MIRVLRLLLLVTSRSPHGERGLKYELKIISLVGLASLPTRGAWIEIRAQGPKGETGASRSPHGERGLKSYKDEQVPPQGYVAPHTGSVD